MQNPWFDLPTVAPYILSEDLKHIHSHRNFSSLRLETLPDQVVGGLNKAEVVFLALNPGFDERDITVNLKLSDFVEANRNNRNDVYNSPFYYFSSGLEVTGGYKWWSKKLKPLLKVGITEVTLREKIMLIEYFPYHSSSWELLPIIPSQQFAFELVREAIYRRKIIVVMRALQQWVAAVPELTMYPYMRPNSRLNVVMSPKNLGETNFNLLVSALRV